MKIYFTTSISQMDEKIQRNCSKIIAFLEKEGHKILHKELLLKTNVDLKKQTKEESLKIQKKLTKYKKSADVILIESTKQSLGIGQEISLSLSLNKPVIVLYSGENTPHVLEDEGKNSLLIAKYKENDLEHILSESIDYASSQQDTRFNFFVAPKHINFLDWIAKNKKIPRSVFLRRLIEREIANDDQYSNQ